MFLTKKTTTKKKDEKKYWTKHITYSTIHGNNVTALLKAVFYELYHSTLAQT